jgi:peptidoglycan/LPS O-acetylase OafA/YrhL
MAMPPLARPVGSIDAPRDNDSRLRFIDSLRGLAALYVLALHLLFFAKLNTQAPPWALLFLGHGGSGVTLFFMISAFSLCYAHEQGFARPGSVVDFFIRRGARILPLFYVMLAVTLLRNAWYHAFPHTVGEVARAALLMFNFIPGEEDGIVPAAWSIGVEVVFYAMFPFLFPRIRNLPRLAVAIMLSLIAATLFRAFVFTLPLSPAAQLSFFNDSLLRRLPVFLMGIGTWIVYSRYLASTIFPLWRGAVLSMASACLYVAYISGGLNIDWPEPYYWEAVVYAGLLTGLGIWPIWPVVSRATVFCGRISYSIYLLHVPVMASLTPLYDAVERWSLPGGMRLLVCLLLTLAFVLPLAMLTYSIVEKPGMRLGKIALQWRRRSGARMAEAAKA